MPRTKTIVIRALTIAVVCLSFHSNTLGQASFLGFDRNEYPGDSSLKELRKTFAFAGYWLNDPPGEKSNSWAGKRATVQEAGFGFLVLFNGRLDRELGNVDHAKTLGQKDAEDAIRAARREGFPAATIIYLDQEQGGRLLPEQKAYLFAWIDGATRAGFRAGVYCSGIAAQEKGGDAIITAEDIRRHASGREIHYWVTNDACPPSPGCAAWGHPALPRESGIEFAEIWQFAQSPKRRDVAASCPGYHSGGSCYAPGNAALGIHIDLDTAESPDPSQGRIRQ